MFAKPKLDNDQEKMTAPALVINNVDPLNAQRIKCRVSALHQNISDTELPWVRPIKDSRSSGGAVSVSVPPVGSIVAVEYVNSDNSNMYWKGLFILDNSLPSDFASSFPNCYGFTDDNNNLYIVDTATKTITYTASNGTSFQINTSNLTLISNNPFYIKVVGDVDMSATGNVNIKGSTVNLNPSSTAADSLASSPRTAVTLPSSSVSNLTNY
jgi:hypothetical protein